MPTRKATAVWNGTVKEGKGSLSVESGTFEADYSFSSRFENGGGTNPEELLGAAEAGCFSMALSMMLTEAGYSPDRIETSASVSIKQKGDDISIPTIELDCRAAVSGIDEDEFEQVAEKARANCPVSKALKGVDISLNARLEQ
jgi:osmotically inducible protein OsmC